MRRLALVALTALFALPAPLAAAKKMPASRPPPTVDRRPPQPPPPALLVRRGDRSVPLKLTQVAIDTQIVGHLAETRMTMTFYNPNNRVLEGDLVFPLPEGSTVSHYALDVNGKLVDGVVVGKERARRIFETEVRKGVDPGLAEWVGGNHFKTRIFPIPAKGSRTIRVGYVSEVLATKDGPRFVLPLDFRDPVGELSLRVEVVKAAVAPAIVRGGPRGLKFGAWRDSFVAESKLSKQALTADLAIALPKLDAQPVRVEASPGGATTFAIRDAALPQTGRPTDALRPRRVGLYWDASMSRAAADAGQEIDLLRRYLEGLGAGPIAVDLTVFRNTAEAPQPFSVPRDIAKLVTTLEGLVYDGGTQLGAAQPRAKGAAKADLNLLFTDGVSNFGADVPERLVAPTWVIASGRTANRPLMRYLAMKTGGAYLHLGRLSPSDALAVVGRPVYSFLGVEARGVAKGSVHPSLPVPVRDTFTLAGRMDGAEATVTLKYGIGDRVLHTREVKIRRADAVKGDLLQRWWAGKRVDDLLVFPEANADEIVDTGKRYGIVTPGTSLLVLERFEQYLEHGVRPPASLPDMRTKYDAEVERRDLQVKRDQQTKLEEVLAMWQARVAWWSKSYQYPKGFRYGGGADKKMGERSRDERPSAAPAGAPSPAPQTEEAEADDRMAAPKTKKKVGGKGRTPEPGVVIKAWDPDTPYLKVLKKTAKAQRYQAYLAQRDEHGSAPAFYLDCAHYFRREGQPVLALRILSNLAELELENAALVRVLAHRLAQVGELDLAAQLFEVALRLRPEEPQSYRDLALVLGRRADEAKAPRADRKADYERAMELLAKVVMGKWDRFAEIEVMALTELNNLLPRAKKVGVAKAPVDPRLVKHLDMDVRIVMTWDADQTDMDLHVLEPSNEEAYYSHNRTTIGGMVSRDFTRGYGPEIYAVRRAMKGRYVIKTKYYGSSAAKLAGGVTLQVDVFTNYGRPNHKRRSLTLRLTESKEMFTVGEIEF